MKQNQLSPLSRHIWALIVLILMGSICLNAVDYILSHSPPLQLNPVSSTPVTLTISGDRDAIDRVVLYYRQPGRPTYQEIQLLKSEITSNTVEMHLPQLQGVTAGYEYYFSVFSAGIEITNPHTNPQMNPHRVRAAARAAVSGNIILLSADTNVELNQDLVFACSFYPIADDIDISSIRVLMNGTDVTGAVVVSPPLIVFTRQRPQPGSYNFQIRANLKNGQTIQSPVWQFNVSERRSIFTDLPYNIRGNINLTSNVRSVSKSDSTRFAGSERNDAALRLHLFAGQNRFRMSSNIYVSSLETSRKQPFNRYGFHLSVPYLDLHLVDYTPNYGSYLISSRNIRGISGRLGSSGLSLSSTYGQSARAIEGSILPDTTYTAGTFRQDTFAAKLDLGEDEGFRMGFGFAKVKDDVSSLEDKSFYIESVVAGPDTIKTFLTSPRDNLVLGTDLRFSFGNQRFVGGVEAAMSIYNSNIYDGAISKDSLEAYIEGSIPFDPEKIENLIIINKNIEPIIPGTANLAFQFYFRWFILNNMLNFSYSEVGASFRSLGAAYVQNDARVISVSDYISLFRNRLSVDAGINIVRDNLSEQKATTTTNTNWYVQTLFRPRNNLPYFRTGINMTNTENDVDANDATLFKLDQESRTYNFGVGYTVDQLPFTSASVDLSVNLSDDKDFADNSASDEDYLPYDWSRNSYHLSILNSLRAIPLQTRLNFSNSTQEDAGDPAKGTETFTSFGLRNEYSFLNGMVVPHLDISLNSYGEDKNTLSRYDIGTRVLPYPRTTVSTRFELTNYQDSNPDMDYNTFGWYLNVNMRF